MKTKGKILIFALLLGSFLYSSAPAFSATSNDQAGFVKGSIWYSKDPFAEGEKIKIYTFVFNPDPRKLEGRIIFLDNSVLLGKADFSVLPNSVKNVSIDWVVTAGDHSIIAKIENSRFVEANGKYQDVYLVGNETEKSNRNVPKTIVPKVEKEVALGAQASSKSSVVADTKLPTVSAEKIVDTVVGLTPEFIATPVVAGANKLEVLRTNISTATIAKKEAVKKEIATLDAKKESGVIKPWKQVQLFFLNIFAFIFNHKFFFYVFWVVLILLIIRIVRRKFF